MAINAETKGETVVIAGTTHTISVATDGVVIDGTTTVSATTMVDGINIDGSRVVGIGVITAPISGGAHSANNPGSAASTTPQGANGSSATQSPSTQSGGAAGTTIPSMTIAGIVAFALLGGWGLL